MTPEEEAHANYDVALRAAAAKRRGGGDPWVELDDARAQRQEAAIRGLERAEIVLWLRREARGLHVADPWRGVYAQIAERIERGEHRR